jgi:tetratricopeptide (TPR) repeat protein
LSGSKKPWVIKTLPIHGQDAVDPAAIKAEATRLSRLRSAHWVEVMASANVENDGGFVMEYFQGQSLAAICRRTNDYSLLLPRELGLVVAHDAFAAAESFYAFEGEGRVHGNISPRTILVGYSGEVKVAGYRPGRYLPASLDAYARTDLKALANLLCELNFEMFPKELANLVPRLLEDNVSSVEAVAAVRAFLHDHPPSTRQRGRVADWLEDLLPGQRQQAEQKASRLLAAALPMLAPSSARMSARRASLLGGTTALLLLLGGGGFYLAHRRPGAAHPEAAALEPAIPAQSGPAPAVAPSVPPPVNCPPKPPMAELATAVPMLPTLPALASSTPMAASPSGKGSAVRPRTSGTPDGMASKPEREESSADRLLRAADEAFDAGKRIEAIGLGTQAVAAGGGVRAQLALAEYYRSMYRYQEALNHYRAAVEIEPDNKLALTGVKMLEKNLSPCQ